LAALNPLRVVVSGYYGFNNLGDEAVLAGIVETFRQRAGEGAVNLTVLSGNSDDTHHRHGLRAVDRMRMPEVRKAIRDSDLFLSGGGSLLQDTTSLRSIFYYLWVVRMALAARKPVMFYAQGIGPLRRRSSRFLTRLIADRVQQITVRDEDSAQLLREIGVRKSPIEVTADPAFALTPADVRAMDIVSAAGDGPLIGIAPRPWHHPHPTPEEYAEIARRLNVDCGARIILLPMHTPGDLELCEAIASQLGDTASVFRTPLTPQVAVGITGRFCVLLAMRLHALIFAATAATPMVALSYDPKVKSLMALLGQPSRNVDLNTFSVEGTVDLVKAALTHSDSTRHELTERATSLRSLALRNADLALQLANQPAP